MSSPISNPLFVFLLVTLYELMCYAEVTHRRLFTPLIISEIIDYKLQMMHDNAAYCILLSEFGMETSLAEPY